MEKLPWIAEVCRVDGGEYPFISCAVHRENGSRLHDAWFDNLADAKKASVTFAAQINAMNTPVYAAKCAVDQGEGVARFNLLNSSEGVGFDYEEVQIEPMDNITPEALEAAGWVRSEAQSDRYELPPSEMYGPELTIWRVGEGPHEITVYCDDASQNVTIGYALTMSEINTITTVAKRTMRKE